VAGTKAGVSPDTIPMVGSAPSYPQGVIDPHAESAQVVREHGSCSMLMPVWDALCSPLHGI